jgi:hypothetical protein
MRPRRGQVVLVASAVVAVALLTMLLAAFQLGYQPTTSEVEAADLSRAEEPLSDAVRRGATDAAGRFSWGERAAAAAVVRAELLPAIERVESAGVGADVVYRAERNDTVADGIARERCPRGEDRQFGECAAHGAMLFQERAGDAYLLGVVVDVRVVGPERTTTATLVVGSRESVTDRVREPAEPSTGTTVGR